MRKSQARSGVTPTRAAIATVATAAAAMAGLSSPALAATPANTSLLASVSQINSLGGTAVTLTGGSSTLSGGSDVPYRVWLTTNTTCSSTYPSASAAYVAAGNGSLSGEILSFNTPPVAPGTYKFCVYDSNATPVLAGTSSTSVLATPWGAPSIPAGPSGGGNSITLNANSGFTGTTFAVEFNTTVCPATYQTTSGTSIIASSTANKSSANTLVTTVPTTVLNNTGYYICVYSGTTTGVSGSPLVARSNNTYGTYTSTLPMATVTPTNGASATASTITLSTAAGTIPTTGTLGALFTRNTCPTSNSGSPSGDQIASTPQRITTGKVAVPVSSSVVSGTGMATTGWNVCLYNAQNAMITAPSVYTVAPQLDVTGVNNAASYSSAAVASSPASVTPTGGPAQGGTAITISNLSGIPTVDGAMLQVSLGGSPLSNVKAVDGTSITGVTTAHAPGSVNLTVTTAAGSKTTAYTLADTGANAGVFNYSYAINVSPNTAAPAATAGVTTNNPWIDITGAGFSGLSFTAASEVGGVTAATIATKAHVLLTDNGWYGQSSGATALTGATGVANPWTAADPPVSQCVGVLVIGDNEIVCQLDLANTITGNTTPATAVIDTGPTAVPSGTYTITVVNSGGNPVLKSASFNYSIVSSGSTFTVASF